eukprot:CAMPEP_0184312738 /NCGR_PEP_ID=MMETSP1049-20130417/52947_1 /TAXON_ID=77928 /ORGANISM="Proteomonas sulcata, Strain CCMP704" /LENGTH=187 /DNA_ID=CAMNT_0026629171 /DNA_START=18 /DNA_END=581 /DNA_ORIENTATION=+
MTTLWRHALGELVVLDDVLRLQPAAGAIFFLLWTFMIVFVLSNIFLAILIGAYHVVNQGQERNTFGDFASKFFTTPINNLFAGYALSKEEEQVEIDTLTTQTAIAREVESQYLGESEYQGSMTSTMAESLAPRERDVFRRQKHKEQRLDVLLQSVLTLSRESRVISKRLKTLEDTDAPLADDPEFFD